MTATAVRSWASLTAAVVVAAAAAAGLLITARAHVARTPALVTVLVERPAGPPERATGFVTSGSRVVTVAHVLDGGGAVMVRDRDGTSRARVVRVDRAADLALLEAGALEGAAASPGGADRVVRLRGGRAEAVPVAIRRHVTARIRDSAGPQLYSRGALELGPDVAGGDSGAPVIGRDGALIGVVFARSDRRDGIAWAVEADAVSALLAR